MAEWYYKIAEQVVGPLSAEQLKALADGGRLAPGDPVARSAEGPWVPASRVKGLFEVAAIDDEPAVKSPPQGQEPPAASGEEKPVEGPPIPQPPVVAPPQAAAPASTQQSEAPGNAPPLVESKPAAGFAIHTEEAAPSERFQKKRGKKARPKEPKAPLTKKEKNLRLVKWLAIAIVVGIAVLVSLPFLRNLTRSAPEVETAKNPIAADVDLAAAGDVLDSPLEIPPPSSPSRPSSVMSAGTAEPGTGNVMESREQVFEAKRPANAVEAKPVRVVLDRPRMTRPDGSGAARPSNRLLLVEMELTAKGEGPSTRFRGWANYENEISLTDDRGLEYGVRTPKWFRGMIVDGQCQEPVFLSAEDPTTDVIVFSWPDEGPELPSTSEEALKLRLPKAAYGEEGELRIAIPLSQIEVTENALEKSVGGPPEMEPGTSDNVEEDDGGPIRIPGLMD